MVSLALVSFPTISSDISSHRSMVFQLQAVPSLPDAIRQSLFGLAVGLPIDAAGKTGDRILHGLLAGRIVRQAAAHICRISDFVPDDMNE